MASSPPALLSSLLSTNCYNTFAPHSLQGGAHNPLNSKRRVITPKFTNQVQRRYDPELLWVRNMISSCLTTELRSTFFMKQVDLIAKLPA